MQNSQAKFNARNDKIKAKIQAFAKKPEFSVIVSTRYCFNCNSVFSIVSLVVMVFEFAW